MLQSRMCRAGRGKWGHDGGHALVMGVLFCAALAGTESSADVRTERWRWSNPLPHGNNVFDLYAEDGLFIQVGDAGAVYVKRSDDRWVPAVTGVSNYLRGAGVLGSRMIVSGENGCILWSDDGYVFQPATLSPSTIDWFEGVTSSGLRAVAAGDNGSIYTSTNGTTWTLATSGTYEWLRGVAYGGGAFVAVGENGKILRSTTGTSWTAVSSGTAAHLNRVRYLGTAAPARFIAVGDKGVVLSSSTGIAPWTSLNSGTTNALYDVALNNTGLLLVGDQELRFLAEGSVAWTNQITGAISNAPPPWVYLSACGLPDTWLVAGRTGLLMTGASTNNSLYAWQPDQESPRAWLWDMTVQKGVYVTVGDLADIQTSLDGILWAREEVPVPHTNTVLLGVGGTSNVLIAVGNDGNVLLSRSETVEMTVTNDVGDGTVVTNMTFDSFGIVWTQQQAFTANTLQGVAAQDSLFIVSGDSGCLFTSADASNWVARTTPTLNFLSGVAIGPHACVAVGANGTLLRAGADGVTWTSVPMATVNWLYRVRWIEDRFIVVGQNGTLYSSTDAMVWNAHASGTTRWLTDVARLEANWYVTGYQGTLLSSTNLVNWSALPVPTIKSIFSAVTGNNRLIVAGVEGVILRNPVIPFLTSVNFLGYDHRAIMNPDLSFSVFDLYLFGGVPDQLFSYQSADGLFQNPWTPHADLELYEPDGTLFLLRTREVVDPPRSEFFRTELIP